MLHSGKNMRGSCIFLESYFITPHHTTRNCHEVERYAVEKHFQECNTMLVEAVMRNKGSIVVSIR